MKKFNKLVKKSKKPEGGDETSSSARAAPAADDARAAYYASRSGAAAPPSSGDPSNAPSRPAARGGAGNPFGDSDDEDEPAPPPRAAPSSSRGANPFGGDSSDEDDDGDPLAGFGRKKPAPAAKAPTPARPARTAQQGGGMERPNVAARASTTGSPSQPPTSSSSANNPFDDSPKPARAADRLTAKAQQAKSSNIDKTNPFDGSPEKKAGNPFGDDDAGRARPNKPGNPFEEPRTAPGSGNNNPFETPNKPKGLAADSKPKGLGADNKPPVASSAGARPGSNPFDATKSAPPLSKPPIAQRSMSHNQVDDLAPLAPAPIASTSTTAAANKKRLSIFGNRIPTDTDSTRPILGGMDEETLASAQQQQWGHKGPSANAAGLASWLRLNKKEDEFDDVPPGSAPIHSLKVKKKPQHQQQQQQQQRTRKKCKAVITPWPFDNFHQVQEQLLYEELASRAASEYASRDNVEGYHSGSDDEKKDDLHSSAAGSEAKYYERPEELPSIKEAVNNLPLVDFEKKAEERAINIVSTWLFDAGLIDELLVNGAVPASAPPSSPDPTVKSSEGVEIGKHGFPLLGSAEGAEQKMDKETNKLRGMIQRDLSIINARLNDGVAASGLEVQELVNAVAATKQDIGRLRELTTYISDGQISDRDEFLLAKYPHLRRAINARRNINRCFRELEFFSQIPSTCDRLRDELHGGEWTEEEWDTIRNVAMEHVELEIMLIEAEASMKAGRNFNDAMVDNFLDSHVQNVWELGDEIRMRMLSGIGSAFELAINNPAGTVALVEAVEVYEKAAESFEKKKLKGTVEDSGKLRFTNMRAAALEQLYQDFEMRGVEMFRGVHEQAADIAEEEDASNTQFTAVLKAATELVTEIDIVKHQMSPCFAPHWHVEALWSSCVAHVCSNHIVQQIGGPDGQNLPDLTITQLLELVAWVEYFRETIEETFPEVAEMRDTKKTYFEERPDLFAGDKRTVNMSNATDSLAWANNMLWEVHRLAQEEFLVRTRSQTDEWLDKVYGSETVKNQSSEGKLTTSLCEDVFSFSSVQLRTIRERLSKKSDALILAVCVILSHMRSKQVHSRNNFLQDLETCCAASNDFTRMSEKCEDMMSDLLSQCEFSDDMIATLEASSNELMAVYSSDAVYSARSVHIYVFDPIEEEIGTRLFESAWEEDMVGNDLALSLIRTLEDFHDDLVHFMDDFMVVKSVMSLMSATVIFYVKCLLMRAEKHRNNKKPYFGDNQTALNRMTGDIKIMREYFEGLVPKMPALKKNIEKDFEILSTIHELMSIAAQLSISEAEDFILVLQKRVRDVSITKHIVGDLWHLVAPTDERYVWELVESMEETLVAIAPIDDALATEVNDRSYVKGLRLDEMAVKLYVKSKRNRPIKGWAAEKIINNWQATWRAEEGNEEET